MRIPRVCGLKNCFLVSMFFANSATILSAQEVSAPIVREATARVAEPTMETLALMRVWQPGDPIRLEPDLKERLERGRPQVRLQPSGPDPLLRAQSVAGSGAQPIVKDVFQGIPATGYAPPDMTGAVGKNHYIQMANVAFAIFDKKGTRLAGPTPINSVWAGFGGPCESENAGDPIARYDQQADRWLISQFAIDAHFQCVAISRGPDPVKDGWFLYAFPTVDANNKPVTPDYPKLSVWPDGYYMGTQRGYPDGGLDVWVFEREKMLAGQNARQVHFSVGAPSLFLMPSDFDGLPPPAGTPNFFARHVNGKQFGGKDRLEIFEFSVNWSDPAKSTFKRTGQIETTPYSSVLCGDAFSGNCATQPGTTVKLETMPAWLMWRLQFRNFGRYQTLLTNHTVNADGKNRAGIRWYELRKTSEGPWVKYQEGTHAPDSANRWMGSIAMDSAGNIALAYSVSSQTEFPSIKLATRTAKDPLGTLAGEKTLVDGKGSQTSSSSRWGDYSSMDVDPVEPCKFWYTNEAYPATSEVGWRTWIVSFQIPQCDEIK